MPYSVSVVIAAFNAEKTLQATIASATGQGENVEIIVVDDGSTDNTAAAARSLVPRIKFLSGPNRGVSAARNWGISEAQGDWIVFLDADDVLAPDTIARRLKCARETQADVIITDWAEFENDYDIVNASVRPRTANWNRFTAEDQDIACAAWFWAANSAILFRRNVIEAVGGFRTDLSVIEDARLLFDIALRGVSFVHEPHCGTFYRMRSGSLSHSAPDRFWYHVLQNGANIENIWRGRGPLSAKHREALAIIYDNAARGLFAAESPQYFEAIERQRGLGGRLPRHSRIAPPIARALGLRSARQLFALVGR